ncbi:aminopeptidase P family N-terminal domain-containing protein [Streptomyces sp. NPDC021749]|uniref:aminopeptidase P family N-terminal domain-containing protein n=1 Tax=Streptomyces sp. NPDC021749 TaxID=3154905 RepID=UPI0033EE7C71
MPHPAPQSSHQSDRPHDLPDPGFPPEEYAQRLAGTREAMARDGLDLLLITAPEDIHYHCGLNHQGPAGHVRVLRHGAGHRGRLRDAHPYALSALTRCRTRYPH